MLINNFSGYSYIEGTGGTSCVSAGITVSDRVNKFGNLQIGAYYFRQPYHIHIHSNFHASTERKIIDAKVQDLLIPVLYDFHSGTRYQFFADAGLYFRFLLKATKSEIYSGSLTDSDIKPPSSAVTNVTAREDFNGPDIGILFKTGILIPISERINLIFYGMYTQLLTSTLGTELNDYGSINYRSYSLNLGVAYSFSNFSLSKYLKKI